MINKRSPQFAIPEAIRLRGEVARMYFKKRQAMLGVLAALPFLAFGIGASILHAPYLHIGGTDQKVSTEITTPWQRGIDLVLDAMTTQPVINAHLVARADDVPVLASPTLALPPSGLSRNDTSLFQRKEDASLAASEIFGDPASGQAIFVVATQDFRAREGGKAPLGTSIPDPRLGYTVLAKPVRNCSRIASEPLCNLSVAQMLPMDKLQEFGGGRYSLPTIDHAAIRWSARNVVMLQPAKNFRLGTTVHLAYLASRLTLIDVEAEQGLSVGSHVPESNTVRHITPAFVEVGT